MATKKTAEPTPNPTTTPNTQQKLSRNIELAWIPPRYRAMVKRAWGRLGPSGRDNAIRCKCYECLGYDGGAADEVRHCNDSTCPLWAFRPGAVVKKK